MPNQTDIFAYSDPLEIVNEYRRGDSSAYEAQGAMELMFSLADNPIAVIRCKFAQDQLNKEIARRVARGIEA